MKIIMLVDMDYFFAACEELRHPEYREMPLVVGADPKGGTARGVVSTCNYVARKLGIHSAMPISMAYRLKKDAIFLPVDYPYYESMSSKVMELVKSFSKRFEQVSIDEAFVDVTDKVDNFEQAVEYAKALKEDIKNKIGLPCSIGISSSRLMAKMACEAGKPDGVRLIKGEDAARFLSPLPVEKLYGIGKKTAEKLESMGFKTVGQLAKANTVSLVSNFGVFGAELYRSANGQGDDGIIENYEIKSIGRERTFESDTTDRGRIVAQIKSIADEVYEEAKKQGVSFKTVTVKIRYHDFSEHLRSRNIGHYSEELAEISENAVQLFDMHAEKDERVRKIGVRVSGLEKRKGQKKMKDFTAP
ncbi:MAG: DNA polymerase IV [Candidatus Micrarchaeota archaeon]|nr:DNA polymerase IV [Candidatus Micrarchaeota archaeon]MDE1848120.1 DNA polymerase IV [Candidatus Micrarchaeota archaeon]MDE1863927.1 DNA polymerase IV [Candidatus Micrarchaeota archaeon]